LFFIIILVFIFVRQNTALMKEKKITIRIDENLRKKYREFCNKNGYSLSKRLRLIIKRDMNEE